MTNRTPTLDPQRFRLAPESALKNGGGEQDESTPLPRHKGGEKFLKGPIPMKWINAAAALPGRALHVGIALWYRAGLEGRNPVKLSQQVMREMGINRNAAYRGLAALEDAGLVFAKREHGKCSVVTLLG